MNEEGAAPRERLFFSGALAVQSVGTLWLGRPAYALWKLRVVTAVSSVGGKSIASELASPNSSAQTRRVAEPRSMTRILHMCIARRDLDLAQGVVTCSQRWPEHVPGWGGS